MFCFFFTITFILFSLTNLGFFLNKTEKKKEHFLLYECGFRSFNKKKIFIGFKNIVIATLLLLYEVEFVFFFPVFFNSFFFNFFLKTYFLLFFFIFFYTFIIDVILDKVNWTFLCLKTTEFY